MKAMKKALALGLALAMVVTAVPVTNAQAATTGLPTKKTYAAGKSYTLKLTTPSSWKSVKTTWSEKDSEISLSSKKAKSVKVKAIKAGSAKVTAKVTFKKASKSYTKKYTCKVNVKEPSLTAAEAAIVPVGSKVDVKATQSWPTTATVTYATSDATIATVDETTGEVTGVKAGTVTITATLTCGTETLTATTEVTVKNAILKSVVQKKATVLEATFDGDVEKVTKGDLTVTNTATNTVFPIKEISVDATKKVVKITTYSEMNDAKEYSVKYDGTEAKFTATDGTVADVAISTATITKGPKGGIVKAQLVDKNTVVIKEFTLREADKDGTVDFSFTENKGYVSDDSLVLLNTGDTATAKVTYHTYKYDSTTGAEIGKIEKTFTVTAVDDDATLSNFNYTISLSSTQVNWNTITKTDNKLSVNDHAYAFFYIKNSNGEDVTDQYYVESSDKSVLLLEKKKLSSTIGTLGSTFVDVTGVKAGSAYINVLNGDGKVVKSLPVVVQETRKLTNVTFNSLTVNKNTSFETKDSTVVKGYDQYQRECGIALDSHTILSAPASDTTHSKGKSNFPVSDITGAVEVDAQTLQEGTYQVELTFKTTDTNLDGTKVSRVLTVNVVNVSSADTSSYALSVSKDKYDLAIAAGKTNTDFMPEKVTAVVNEYKKGAKVGTVADAVITIKNPDGKVVGSGTGSANTNLYQSVTSAAVTSGAAFAVTAYTTNTDIKAGTYTVYAESSSLKKKFNTTFVLENSQTKAVAYIDKNAASSIINSGDAKNDAKLLLEELAGYAAFTYSYDGRNQTVMIYNVDAKENGKALYITSVDVVVVNDAGEKIIVNAPINTAFTLK